MKTAVVCESTHHGNTRRVAIALAEAVGADLLSASDVLRAGLGEYALAGFGSGIYFGRHDRELLHAATLAPHVPKNVFIFSTAGLPCFSWIWHYSLRRRLKCHGSRVCGEFCCAGWDTVGPLVLFGGLNRRRPDDRDLERAADFAYRMRQAAEAAASPE